MKSFKVCFAVLANYGVSSIDISTAASHSTDV